jgi:hypothetical protein
MPGHGLSGPELARALLTGDHCSGLFETPPLFSDTTPTRPDLEKQLTAVNNDPFLVRDSRDTQDTLTQLLLGSKIVDNALFSVYLRNLNPKLTSAFTDAAIDAVREHLIWK